MTCPSCGTSNLPGSKFCNACGSALATGCPSCGTANPPGSRFCRECGANLGVDQAPAASETFPPATRAGAGSGPAEAAPVAERRLVSVLFADLVGFTTLAEGRDPEETRELLSRYFELARDIVERYGGTVEKFIGDAVMAVWGAPVAREDDAERAVRAGLELVAAVRTVDPDLQARAGVLTGEAAVTLGAVGQGMVAGDLVNTASRLQAAALPGTVLVGEATVRAADRAIAFEPAGAATLKGKAAPVPAWRALRVVAERGGRNRRDTLEAPFVGRDDELRLLKDLFHATGREGRARLISLIGPAGIGKSRLAWEFLKYVDGLVENVWWHDGRSPAYGEGITFWALGEMVRGRCGLVESDDEPTTRAKVGATLREHVPDEAERRWIEPALLALLGVETAARSEELFGAWRTFFERLAASGSVVMVFEDLHFADPGLLDFVDSLLEWSRTSPIYVLTLARPELLEKRADWGAGKRNFTSIYLEPLAEPAMRELLAGLVPGLPPAAVRAIVARADGVPLYAVETVRMLVAQDRLRPEGAVYRPTGDLTELAVPDTLTALIAARLDGLGPAERALVSDAAVLGQSFTLAGLAAVAGRPEAEIEPHLRSLVRRELLTLEADARSPERGQYAFVQALIREVAYNTLAKSDRKVRHLAAARFFEALGSDELAGALAGHYLAAYRSAPPGSEADALAGQARIALGAAADRAAGLGAHAQAVGFLEEALTVAADTDEAAQLHERAAASATVIMRIDEADAHLRAALEIRRARGERAAEASATAALGAAMLVAYRVEPALALLSEAAQRLADLGDDPGLARLDGQLARALFLHDEDRKALEVCERVLEAAERTEQVDVIADTLVTKGSALLSVGRRYEGIGAIEAGRNLAASHSIQLTVSRALNNLASFLMDSDPRASLAAAREGIALARRLGLRSFQLLDNSFGGSVRTGEWDWAVAEFERVRGEDLDPLTRATVLGDLASLRAQRGEPTGELLAELEELPGNDSDTAQASNIAAARAWIAFADGRFDTVRSEARLVAELFSQATAEAYLLSARAAILARLPAEARRDLARVEATGRRGRAIDTERATIEAGLAALDGLHDEAIARYRDALRVWRDLGLVWDEALCASDMAILLGPGDPEVRAAADRAREILVRLGARPLVERLDAAMARRPAEGGRLPALQPDVSTAVADAKGTPA